MLKKIFTFIVLCSFFVAGCSSNGPTLGPDDIPPAVPVNKSPTYKIGVGDVLKIGVWKNPELASEVPVRPDGYVSVPLIGDIRAGGLTPEAVAQEIEGKLSKFIRNPQASVIVSKLVSHEFQSRVRVVGAVVAPRSISHRPGMTVLDLVLEAGGINEFAEGDLARLFRKTDDGVKEYPVLLENILNKGGLESNYLLQPGDVVSIPERRF